MELFTTSKVTLVVLPINIVLLSIIVEKQLLFYFSVMYQIPTTTVGKSTKTTDYHLPANYRTMVLRIEYNVL